MLAKRAYPLLINVVYNEDVFVNPTSAVKVLILFVKTRLVDRKFVDIPAARIPVAVMVSITALPVLIKPTPRELIAVL